MSIQTWVVSHEGKTILIDTEAGNDEDRPNLKVLHHLHHPYLKRLESIAIGATGARAQNEEDKLAIDAVVGRFMEAWDRHEAHAVASVFVEDADFTNVRGTHVHGRKAVEEFLAPLFAGMLKESHLTGKLRSLRFLKPDVAIIDIDWEMTGQTTSGGVAAPPIEGLLDWALTKTHGHWLVTVMHNAKLPENALAPRGN